MIWGYPYFRKPPLISILKVSPVASQAPWRLGGAQVQLLQGSRGPLCRSHAGHGAFVEGRSRDGPGEDHPGHLDGAGLGWLVFFGVLMLGR